MYERLNAKLVSPEKFVLVVGSNRSGTTIAGAIIDSHPRMLCANKSTASMRLWRDMTRSQIVENIIENCRHNIAADRPSEGYLYGVPTRDKDSAAISVIGDKVWNSALLIMAGQRHLLSSLQERTGADVMLLNCVRNPFDVIATMHRRSGASLRDRFRWYVMYCEATQMLVERDEWPMMTLRHEDLIDDPKKYPCRYSTGLVIRPTETACNRYEKRCSKNLIGVEMRPIGPLISSVKSKGCRTAFRFWSDTASMSIELRADNASLARRRLRLPAVGMRSARPFSRCGRRWPAAAGRMRGSARSASTPHAIAANPGAFSRRQRRRRPSVAFGDTFSRKGRRGRRALPPKRLLARIHPALVQN